MSNRAPFQTTVCPSGLRGWTQVPLERSAWVQIPQLSDRIMPELDQSQIPEDNNWTACWGRAKGARKTSVVGGVMSLSAPGFEPGSSWPQCDILIARPRESVPPGEGALLGRAERGYWAMAAKAALLFLSLHCVCACARFSARCFGSNVVAGLVVFVDAFCCRTASVALLVFAYFPAPRRGARRSGHAETAQRALGYMGTPVKISNRTVCPSGLRGWTQVPLERSAWAQIPQLSSTRANLKRGASTPKKSEKLRSCGLMDKAPPS